MEEREKERNEGRRIKEHKKERDLSLIPCSVYYFRSSGLLSLGRGHCTVLHVSLCHLFCADVREGARQYEAQHSAKLRGKL